MNIIYYARHVHDWWDDYPCPMCKGSLLKYLYEKRAIAIYFSGVESWDVEDYSGQGKSAISYMNECNNGTHNCYIFASYKIDGKQKIVLGKPRVNSKCYLREHFNVSEEKPIKLLFLDEVREITLKDFPFAYLLAPKQSTFVQWKQCKKIANSYIQGKKPDNLDPSSYLPMALEILCEEYLRKKGVFIHKLAKTGGALKDFDLLGVDKNNNIVGAQVKSRTLDKVIRQFSETCGSLGEGNYYFFTEGDYSELFFLNLKIISLTDVLNTFKDNLEYLDKLMLFIS